MFYDFSQNNSGGNFHHDSFHGIGYHVIIEADSAEEANMLAESKGIYFNGCDDDRDCPCCGDRWSSVWSDDRGTETPTMYGGPVTGGWGIPSYIHYKNGTVAAVGDER